MATEPMSGLEILIRLKHPLYKVGRAGVAGTTNGGNVTIWLFDGQMGATFKDVKIGVVNGQQWTTDAEPKTFKGRGWKVNIAAEIDAEVQRVLDRMGVAL